MARRSVTGQLNMFDFWSNLDPAENSAEVQMVSLIPEEDENATEAEIEAEVEPIVEAKPVVEVEPVVESEPEAEVEPVVEAEPEAEVEPVVEAESEAEAESVVEVEPKVETEPVMDLKKAEAPVMHKECCDAQGNVVAEISYFNYNKIYIRKRNQEPKWLYFDHSKEAVDYYIEEMLRLEEEDNDND